MDEQNRVSDSKEAGREDKRSENQSTDEHRRGGRNRHRGNPRQAHQQNVAKSSLNMNELRELAELINEHGFTEFEFENENIRVRLRKELAQQIIQAAPAAQMVTTAPVMPATSSAQTAESIQSQNAVTAASSSAGATADEDASSKKIFSPIVGTFYRAPSPEVDPFVKIGSQVSSETIVCIVEAMKLMNEIPAEISGEIVKIYVENGQPVEYGQPLFAVK